MRAQGIHNIIVFTYVYVYRAASCLGLRGFLLISIGF